MGIPAAVAIGAKFIRDNPPVPDIPAYRPVRPGTERNPYIAGQDLVAGWRVCLGKDGLQVFPSVSEPGEQYVGIVKRNVKRGQPVELAEPATVDGPIIVDGGLAGTTPQT